MSDPSTLSPVALAYVRARNSDPMCSFGDFAAVSHNVDAATAAVLKSEVTICVQPLHLLLLSPAVCVL